MQGGQGPTKRDNPEVWATCLHRVWQRASLVSEIIQTLSKTLMVKWKLPTANRPQSSGKVEHMNQTLKTTLATLCQETHLPWVVMLPQPCSEPSAPWDPQAILLWDLIRETTPSDKEAQGRLPTTSWPEDVLTPPGPGKSLLPYHSRNLRKDSCSFWQLGSFL